MHLSPPRPNGWDHRWMNSIQLEGYCIRTYICTYHQACANLHYDHHVIVLIIPPSKESAKHECKKKVNQHSSSDNEYICTPVWRAEVRVLLGGFKAPASSDGHPYKGLLSHSPQMRCITLISILWSLCNSIWQGQYQYPYHVRSSSLTWYWAPM